MERIYYKVVAKETRYGSNALGFVTADFGPPNWDLFYEKINDVKLLQPYFPVYKKGALIKPVDNSPGIFALKEEIDALNFINKHFCQKDCEIIMVTGEPIKNDTTFYFFFECFNIDNLWLQMGATKYNAIQFNNESAYHNTVFLKYATVLE